MPDPIDLLRRAKTELDRLGASDPSAKALADEIGKALTSGQLPGMASSSHTRITTGHMDASDSFSADAVVTRKTEDDHSDSLAGGSDSLPGGADSMSGPA